MPWKKMLAWAAGQIEPLLLQKLEFVIEENRVYHALLDRHAPHWRLTNPERIALAEKGKPLGQWLSDIITIVQPQTLLKWHRKLIPKKWDFSDRRQTKPGRPPLTTEIEKLVVQFAQDNPSWGYDHIAGALANLGIVVSDQTVGNVLKKHGLGPTDERKRHVTWAQFIRRHKDMLWATDFFTTEVWTSTGLTTFYVLFFIHVQTRRIVLGGTTPSPNEAWMKQVARNLTAEDGPIQNARFLLHDRDAKYSEGFDAIFVTAGIEPLKLPSQSPNLNAFAERWVRSVRDECLNQLILFGERSLRRVLREYLDHHHHERNHQGLDNVIPFPGGRSEPGNGKIIKSARLGGLLNFYHRAAA